MAQLRIGTCSWKYPSWEGLVYSAAKGIDYLAEYALKYDTVEVDQWFWSLSQGGKAKLPDPNDVKRYRRAVADDFRFTVKVPNSITLTHFYKKSNSDALQPNPLFLSDSLFLEFLSCLEPIKDLLGPLIFQFEYLNKSKIKSSRAFIDRFENFIGRLPHGYQYALEVRNAGFYTAELFEFLDRSRFSHVFLQGYWMPPIPGLYRRWRPLLAKHGLVVIRLHGPNRQEIEKTTGKVWDKVVAPKDEEIPSIATMINDLLDSGVDVYLNVNNHYEGSAPLTIEKIKNALAKT